MGTWHCRGFGVQAVHPAGAGEIGGVGAEDKNAQEQHAEGNPGLVKHSSGWVEAPLKIIDEPFFQVSSFRYLIQA